MNGEEFLAATVAAVLTIFDLDRTFYLPSKVNKKRKLWFWYWAFIFANGLLAFGLDAWIQQARLIDTINWVWRGFAVGGAYLAIIRTKFTTFEIGGKAIPFGLELIYEAAKNFAYQRINRIAKEARRTEATELANSASIKELGQQARLSIGQDALMSDEDKRATKEWLLATIKEAQPGDDFDQRAAIADYLLSNRRAP